MNRRAEPGLPTWPPLWLCGLQLQLEGLLCIEADGLNLQSIAGVFFGTNGNLSFLVALVVPLTVQ